jgi:hypothetical protein
MHDDDDEDDAGSGFFTADNGCAFTGQELMMIGLHRLSVLGSLSQSMSKIFEIDFSLLSRAFALFIGHTLQHNDLEVMEASELNAILAQLQINGLIQYKSYGDGIFIVDTHCVGKFFVNPTPDQRYIIRGMSSMRIANE